MEGDSSTFRWTALGNDEYSEEFNDLGNYMDDELSKNPQHTATFTGSAWNTETIFSHPL